MNDFIKEQDRLCAEAVKEILSIKIIDQDRISHLLEQYFELYKINQFTLDKDKVVFTRLYFYLSDLKKYLDKLESAIDALTEYNKIKENTEINIISWLIKFEDLGVYLRSIIYSTGLENLDEIPDGSVYIHPDYDIKILVSPFVPILNFVSIFDSEYRKIIEKYNPKSLIINH